MASICFISSDTTHRAATYIGPIIVGFGHTVTYKNDSTISSISDVNTFDLLVIIRPTGGGTMSSEHTIIRAAMAAGIPVIFGGPFTGAANGVESVSNQYPIACKLCNDLFTSNTSASIYIQNVSHDILSGITGLPKDDAVYSAATFQSYEYDGATSGTILASFTSSNTDYGALVAYEATDLDTSSTAFGARCVLGSFFYSTGTITLTADAQTILSNSITWALGGTPPVSLAGRTGRRKLS